MVNNEGEIVDLTILEKNAKECGVKIGFFNKGLYKMIAAQLPNDEGIKFMAEGFDARSANKIPLIITNKAAYIASFASMLGGLSFTTIPLQKISSVTISGGILSTVTIAEGTRLHEVPGIASVYTAKITAALKE